MLRYVGVTATCVQCGWLTVLLLKSWIWEVFNVTCPPGPYVRSARSIHGRSVEKARDGVGRLCTWHMTPCRLTWCGTQLCGSQLEDLDEPHVEMSPDHTWWEVYTREQMLGRVGASRSMSKEGLPLSWWRTILRVTHISAVVPGHKPVAWATAHYSYTSLKKINGSKGLKMVFGVMSSHFLVAVIWAGS